MPRYKLSPRLWLDVSEVDTAESTNDCLRLAHRPGEDREALVTAEHQSAGRGATGSWHSERGQNLLFSLLTRPKALEARDVFILSQVACLALCLSVESLAEGFRIKWPNDIYHDDRKLAGILIENDLAGRRIASCITGVGLNVNQTSFPASLPNPTSLALITGHTLDRSPLLEAFLSHHARLMAMAGDGRAEEIREAYHARLYRLSQPAHFRDATGQFTATIRGVESSGHIVMTDSEGRPRRYAFKQVQFAT